MQLYRKHGTTASDWKVSLANGGLVVVPKIDHAYVDEHTGTLHLMSNNATIYAIARGAWLLVTPA